MENDVQSSLHDEIQFLEELVPVDLYAVDAGCHGDSDGNFGCMIRGVFRT
jgi:hypothetical protein